MFWSIIVIAIAALMAYLAYLWRSCFKPDGINPFFISKTPKRKLVTDRKARDKVLKNVFAKEKVPSNLDAIVIGSGIGGLSCAATLAKAGKRVLVLEQHDQAGGCCHTYVEKGYEFDVGIHYVGNVGSKDSDRALSDMITDCQLDWAPLDKAFDVIQFGFEKDTARRYDVLAGLNVYKEYLLKKFPQETDAIEKYFQLIHLCDQEQQRAFWLKILPHWFSKLLIFTGLVKVFTKYFEVNKYITVGTIMTITTNTELQAVLQYSFANYGTAPDKSGFPTHANLHNHFSEGAYYPVGGASEIPFNIIPLIQRTGGAVLVRARVTQILINKSNSAEGVTVVKNGSNVDQEMVIMAPIIISGAGIYNTFQRLLPEPIAQRSYFYEITKQLKPGIPLFSVFVGLDVDDAELDAKAQNTWAFCDPDDIQGPVNGDVVLSKEMKQYSLMKWLKVMIDYIILPSEKVPDMDPPILFVSFPSKKDPTWAERYPGKSTLVIITASIYEWFQNWEDTHHRSRDMDYDALKNGVGYRMLAQVERMFPQIKGKVDYLEFGSPLSNNFFLNSTRGEVYGMDHAMQRFSAPMMAKLRPETDIKGLYLTGQDTYFSGFVGAMRAGMITSSIVLGRQFTCMNDIEAMVKSAMHE